MSNKVLANIFYEIAEFLKIEQTKNSKFKIIAYEKAALTLETLQEPVEDIYKKYGKKGLMKLPGIGSALANKIEEFIKTNKINKYEEFKEKYPIQFKELINVKSIGVKKAILLYQKLNIKNISDLKKAIEENKISKIHDFGIKSQNLIEKSIEFLEKGNGKILLGEALPIAENIINELKETNLIERVEILGSIRRMKETISNINILVISNQHKKLIDFFSNINECESIIMKTESKISLLLKSGINCDVYITNNKSFANMLQYFTGSKEHNIILNEIAISKGLKINEYCLLDNENKLIYCNNEEAIYKNLDLQYIPPEMREARGEIELAKKYQIPSLVDLNDLLGDLHIHTNDSDGENTLEQIADASIQNKLKYIAIANHTKSLRIANGLDEKRFLNLFEKIDKLNEKLGNKLVLLKSAEVDILKNGSLDLDNKILNQMDCVVAAIHSNFEMNKNDMTNRIIKAIETKKVNILAHPTGRLINKRPGYLLDLDKIFEVCEKNNVALEINSFPNRLDLNDDNILLASHYNLMFSINTDSHSIEHLKFLKYGIGIARRGWLTKQKIINTKSLRELKVFLKK